MGHIANLRKISLKKQALAKLSLLSPLEKEDGPPFAGIFKSKHNRSRGLTGVKASSESMVECHSRGTGGRGRGVETHHF